MHRLAGLVTTSLGVAALAIASPASAELIGAKDPRQIIDVLKSNDFPATLNVPTGENPYIESSHNGMKFLVLFMNCDDDHENCATVQFYMGFTDAKETTLDAFNEWNKGKRFARAYRDDEGDAVMEMDLDLDFGGLPRENVAEAFKTWTSLMDAYHEFLFES